MSTTEERRFNLSGRERESKLRETLERVATERDALLEQLDAARAQLTEREGLLRECVDLFRRALPHIGPRIPEKAIRDLLQRIEAALDVRSDV